MRTTRKVVNDTLVITVEYFAGAGFGWLPVKTETYTREQIIVILAQKPERDPTRFAIA